MWLPNRKDLTVQRDSARIRGVLLGRRVLRGGGTTRVSRTAGTRGAGRMLLGEAATFLGGGHLGDLV